MAVVAVVQRLDDGEDKLVAVPPDRVDKPGRLVDASLLESADLVLVENDPLDVIRVLRLSRATYRKMVQNLFWATGYNTVAIPLAAGVLAPVGILLSPAVGTLLMSLSTVIVTANAMLLRRVSLA